jgi:hypothetical protein
MSQAEARASVLTGGCQCGAVRYALYAMPEGVSVCHCRMCQKAVGGPFATYAPVRKRDFGWTRGTPGTFQSSTAAARDFCATCGTPLTFRYLPKDWIDVSLGSLDRPELAPPTEQFGVESRLPWTSGIQSLPGRRTDDPTTPDYVRGLTSFQHPDHDTPPGWRPASAAQERQRGSRDASG